MAPTQDVQWIEDAVRSMKLLHPRAAGPEHVRAREAWAQDHVSKLSPDRVPRLIVALFELYESRKSHAFSELMWLIEALYGALPSRINTDDACGILASTRHSCGHGGIEDPIDLARSAFGDAPYSPAFFDALRTYRGRFEGLHSAEVTRARGNIALILWQDPRERLQPANCLSRGVRDGIFALPESRRAAWILLLREVDRSSRRRPDRKWTRLAATRLQSIGAETFAADLARWLKPPEGRASLSTGGRHVLKTLIWYAALAKTDKLDDVLPMLIDLNYEKSKAAVHLIYAVGYWLADRPPEIAERHRMHLREKWPTAGSRIQG